MPWVCSDRHTTSQLYTLAQSWFAKWLGDPTNSCASLAISVLGSFQKYTQETTSSGPGCCMQFRKKKKYKLEGCSAKLFSWTRETQTKTLFFCAGGFMLWGIESLLIFEVCSWHLSQHVYYLKKHIHDAKNTPQSHLTAGRQNVTFGFFYFLLIFGHFHKYNVYPYFVFPYKSRLKMNKA